VAHRAAAGQLTLDFIEPAARAGLPTVVPMSPVSGAGPFDDDEWFFEPWWPGAQAIVYVENGRIRLQTDHMADPNPAFRELGGIAGQFAADRAIVHGTLLVLDEEGRPDADLLRRRLSGDDAAARVGYPALVVSDLLHVRGDSLLSTAFEDRRAQLTRLLRDGDLCVVGRGLRTDGTTLAEAAAAMGMTEISARRLSARYRPGASDDDWRRLPVAETASAPARPFLALLQRLPL
jgi:bifunctional non-homologous end joining protein LigD